MRYKISELAKLLDVSTNTIRRYEGYGHLSSSRNEDNGYRIYDKGDVTKLMSIRNLRKYGFAHHEILEMNDYSLDNLIDTYDRQILLMEEQLAYNKSLKERLNDDLILLKKVKNEKDIRYVRECISYSYILYQADDRLLLEEERIKKIHEYLYATPKVQMIYIIKKDDVDRNNIKISMGWAMKQRDFEECHISKNQYTLNYPSRTTLISIVKVPIIANYLNDSKSKLINDLLLSDTFDYMSENDYTLDGDILGVKVTTTIEEEVHYEYVLLNIPIKLIECNKRSVIKSK